MNHVHQDKLLDFIEQIKVITYQFWVGFYGPLFWLISAIVLHWNFDKNNHEFDFTHSIEFVPIPEEPVAPWEPQEINLTKKRSLKALKDQFNGWKQKKDRPHRLGNRQHSSPSLPIKEPRVPFLRRFSSSSECSHDKKKSLRAAFIQSEPIQKLKALNFKLKKV